MKETSLPSETREVPGVSSKATKTLFLGPREAFKFYDCNLDSSAVQCHCCVLHTENELTSDEGAHIKLVASVLNFQKLRKSSKLLKLGFSA